MSNLLNNGRKLNPESPRRALNKMLKAEFVRDLAKSRKDPPFQCLLQIHEQLVEELGDQEIVRQLNNCLFDQSFMAPEIFNDAVIRYSRCLDDLVVKHEKFNVLSSIWEEGMEKYKKVMNEYEAKFCSELV